DPVLHSFPTRRSSDLFVLGGIYQSADGRIWIGTAGGLTEFSEGRFLSYTANQGLNNRNIGPGVEDRDGNLWLVSPTGAMKITWRDRKSTRLNSVTWPA